VSVPITFNAPSAGEAVATFVIDGFGSLDGQNGFEDDFILSLNNTQILMGTYNLGGGGNSIT
jgi:hypothetical protein